MGKNNDLKKQRKLLEEQKNSLLQSIKKINDEIDFLNKKYDEIELIKNTLLENPSLENNHIAIKQMEEEQAKITTQIENKAIEIKKLDENDIKTLIKKIK